MRLNINLATQPYEDARRFWLQWGAALVAVVALTIVLGYAAVADFVSKGGINRQMRDMRAEIAKRDQKRAQAQAFLNRLENRDTRDKSQFINALIARKAFSWTQVFAALEKMMPPGLQVVSIKPEVNDNNQLELRIVVTGNDRARAVELVRKLEGSSQFRQAVIRQENAGQPPNESKVAFEISAQYIPAAAGTPPATEAASAPQGGTQ